MREEIEEAFERFVEKNWRYAVNIAASELVNWEAGETRSDKSVAEKQAGNPRNHGVQEAVEELPQLKQLQAARGREGVGSSGC